VLLSDPTLDYFVKVNATSPTTSPTVTLTFEKRTFMTDLGSIGAGTSAMRAGESLTTTTTTRFYLFRAPIGSSVTITVTPVTGTLNTNIRRLTADEATIGATVNNGGNGAADSVTFTQAGSDWSAFAVAASTSLTSGPTYNVSVSVQ